MSDGLKIQGEVVLSAEGAEAALNRVADVGDKMASRLNESAKKAGDAVDGIGSGANESAEKFTRAEGKIIDSIKRATTSLENFGKTASEKLDLRIADRGLDASKFEPYLAKLRELEAANARLGASGQAAFGGQFTNNVRNASFQLQDYIVQVNGGVDSTKALAMQLPQLLGGFGALGAGIGVVAALMPQIVSAFSTTTEKSVPLKEAIAGVEGAFSTIQKSAEVFSMAKVIDSFNAAGKEARAATVDVMKFNVAVAGRELNLLEKSIADTTGKFKDFTGLFGSAASDQINKFFDIKSLQGNAKDYESFLKFQKEVIAGTLDMNAAYANYAPLFAKYSESGVEFGKSLGLLKEKRLELAKATEVLNAAEKAGETGKLEGGTEKVKKIAAEIKAIEALLGTINSKDSGLDSNYVKNVNLLLSAYDKGSLSLGAFNEAFARYVAMQPAAVAASKAQAEAIKEQSKWIDEWADSRQKESNELAGQVTKAREYLDNLGLTKEAQERLAAGKYELAAAAKEEYAANLENAAVYAGDFKDAYLEAAAAVRDQAAALNDLAAIKRQTSAKEIAVSQAKESARAWEKFGDDIERSLTDSLYRSFESGKSFGQSFVDSLKNTFKSTLLKMAVQYTINAGGQIAGAAGNTIFNAVTGMGSANGGNGFNVFNVASNASSLYGLATGTYLGYAQAAGAGYAMTSAEAAAAAQAYYQAGYYGTGAAIQAGSAVGGGTGAAAGSSASGASSSAAGVSSVAWVAAIIAGMWMSSEAWKAGIRWENYAKQKDVELWDAEVNIRRMHDEPARAIFGDGFVDSQLYAILGGGSLSAQIHYAIQGALFGKKYQTGSQTAGTFSEADQGFSGAYGINMKKTGGLFSSSREWTDWYALPADVDGIMDTLYRGVRNSFVMLGETFDDTTVAAKLRGFSYQFNVASTSMAAIADAASNGLAKAMGDVITPSITSLVASGETWTAAFQRIMLEANSVSRVIGMMGDTMSGVFGTNNLDGVLKASDAFVKLFGTLDNFNSSFNAYYANFYNGYEQAQQAWKDMAASFTNIGITDMPTTRQQFRSLVDAQNLNTESGRATFQSLMSLQAAFAALTPTIDDATAAARALANVGLDDQAKQIGAYYTAQRQTLADSIRSDMSAAQDAISNAGSLIESLGSVISGLGTYRESLVSGAASVSPEDQYQMARRMFDSTASRARLGDLVASGNLQSVSETLLQASLATGTSSSYSRDVGLVASTLDSVIGVAERQVPIAQSQLEVAQNQLSTLEQMLARMTGATPAVVSNYTSALADWQSFFTTTAIGQSVQTSAGTMQRIADAVGLFIDKSGMGYTFNAGDSPYALAGMSQDFADYMKQKYGTWQGPSFASGGVHSGGLRPVGENGPELEFTGPSRILNAADSASLLGNSSAVIDELRAVRQELETLRKEQRAGDAANVNASVRTAKLLEKFDIDGMPEVRAA